MKLKHWLLGIFCCFFSFNLFAENCTHDMDCHGDWQKNHCLCGVHGICSGVTKKNPGTCQCFGKEGSCTENSSGSQKTRVRSANSLQRQSGQ